MSNGVNQKLITNTTVYVTLVLVAWLAAWPAWSSFKTELKEINLKKQTIALEQQVIDKLNSINQVLDSQKDNVARLEQAIPEAEFKPEILSMMENLASQSGLGLAAIDVKPPAQEQASRGSARSPVGSLKALKITLKASGTYSAFKNWLVAVEKNLRLMDVADIDFTIQEKKTAEGEILPVVDPVIDYVVGVDTYVLKKQ